MHKPLPEKIAEGDITWQADLLRLAAGLIREGAKPKLVRRYTLMKQSELKMLWTALRGDGLTSGPISRQTPSFFTTARNSECAPGPLWNIQGAMFLECVQWLQRCVDYRVNIAWLLLNAYQAYLRQTDSLGREGLKRLDINQAYSLMLLSGITSSIEYSEIALHRCTCHNRNYLIDTAIDLTSQRCPIQIMEDNHKRLIEAGKRGNVTRWGTQGGKKSAAA